MWSTNHKFNWKNVYIRLFTYFVNWSQWIFHLNNNNFLELVFRFVLQFCTYSYINKINDSISEFITDFSTRGNSGSMHQVHKKKIRHKNNNWRQYEINKSRSRKREIRKTIGKLLNKTKITTKSRSSTAHRSENP